MTPTAPEIAMAEPSGWPLELAKRAMVEASGLSPLWGEEAAINGARACIVAYLAAVKDERRKKGRRLAKWVMEGQK